MLIEISAILTVLWLGTMGYSLRPAHALIRARRGK